MMHADAAHTKDVLLACVVACDPAGVIIAQSAYSEFEVLLKFNRSTLHCVASNKLYSLLKLHSVNQALVAVLELSVLLCYSTHFSLTDKDFMTFPLC